jgi:hypothetical protein
MSTNHIKHQCITGAVDAHTDQQKKNLFNAIQRQPLKAIHHTSKKKKKESVKNIKNQSPLF